MSLDPNILKCPRCLSAQYDGVQCFSCFYTENAEPPVNRWENPSYELHMDRVKRQLKEKDPNA